MRVQGFNAAEKSRSCGGDRQVTLEPAFPEFLNKRYFVAT